jgi:protein gp37
MAQKSNIEWTEATWNPVTGCTKVSEGCLNCYAEKLALRLKAMGQRNYVNGFNVAIHQKSLDMPLRWKRPQIIFVNSMSDLFHEKVPTEFIVRVFNVMNMANRHVFQILTKRPERLLSIADKLPWPSHIWMGVTVESEKCIDRIDYLKSTKAYVKFLSLEPLLGPIKKLDLRGINWVIVGGESGPGARPIKKDWVIDIRDRCIKFRVPFFFKQWGGINRKRTGCLLEGKKWNQMPNLGNLEERQFILSP